MSCCKKEVKSEPTESCCEGKEQEKAAKAAQQSSKSGCGCASGKDPAVKKEEKKEASCC